MLQSGLTKFGCASHDRQRRRNGYSHQGRLSAKSMIRVSHCGTTVKCLTVIVSIVRRRRSRVNICKSSPVLASQIWSFPAKPTPTTFSPSSRKEWCSEAPDDILGCIVNGAVLSYLCTTKCFSRVEAMTAGRPVFGSQTMFASSLKQI